MSPRSCTDQRAFTLIEVSLAFVLMALMLLILYSSFALSSRAEERVAIRFEKNQKIRAVEGLLAGYIRSAFPYRQGGDSAGVVFSGTAADLSFISALSVLTGNRGLASVTLAVGTDEAGRGILTLEETLLVQLNDGAAEGDGGFTNGVILADNLTRAQISYLEVIEDQEEWLSDWDGGQKAGLPRAVRIILEAEGVEPTEWVFPVMVKVLTIT